MIRRVVVVRNNLGLHARAAARLVRLASRFDSAVYLSKENADQHIDCKSILGVLMLAAAKGCRLEVTVTGPDEGEACDSIEQIFKEGFGEED